MDSALGATGLIVYAALWMVAFALADAKMTTDQVLLGAIVSALMLWFLSDEPGSVFRTIGLFAAVLVVWPWWLVKGLLASSSSPS